MKVTGTLKSETKEMVKKATADDFDFFSKD
jgi:hypothetical protein